MPFQPMLAAKDPVIENLPFPLIISAKLDGVRCIIQDKQAKSRSMKPIRNRYVQGVFASFVADLGGRVDGLDGELIVGSPTDPRALHNTTSGVNSFDEDPTFTFYVFDLVRLAPYAHRLAELSQLVLDAHALGHTWVKMHPARVCETADELLEFETAVLAEGYEGVIARSPNAPYKQGRSTLREAGMVKVKRFEDAEAEVIGFEERMHNENEAKKDALGHTKRSSHQENLVPMDTLGAFIVRGVNGQFAGKTFNVGSGMNDAERALFWSQRPALMGKLVKYKHFNIGVKDLPRHPIFLGFRDEDDMS